MQIKHLQAMKSSNLVPDNGAGIKISLNENFVKKKK